MKKEELSGALTALRQAIANEQDGRRFYQEAAKRTTDKNGKRMFNFLVEEEEQHFNALVAEYEAISGGGMWIPLDSARRITPSGTSLALFPHDRDVAKQVLPSDASDLEALKMAMDFETEGYNMYQRAGEETPDPLGKAVYHAMAKEENKHFTMLQKSHEYLSSKGMWLFDDFEKPSFDGP